MGVGEECEKEEEEEEEEGENEKRRDGMSLSLCVSEIEKQKGGKMTHESYENAKGEGEKNNVCQSEATV